MQDDRGPPREGRERVRPSRAGTVDLPAGSRQGSVFSRRVRILRIPVGPVGATGERRPPGTRPGYRPVLSPCPGEELTMSRKPKTGTTPFRPRARLLKLIGEELISDDV